MIDLGTLGVTTFPVGDDVLVHKDYFVVAPNNIGRVDFGIAAAVDCFAIQSVEAKLPTMIVSVGKAINIMRAGPSCGGNAAAVNMTGQYNVSWCDVCISNRGTGWLVWIKWESGSAGTPVMVRVKASTILTPLGGGGTLAIILLAVALAISRVVWSRISL
jgi:hypothetical protein